MTRHSELVLPLLALALIGCENVNYTSQNLGRVGYDHAFDTAVEVFRGYYPVASTNREKGMIYGAPRPVDSAPDRILSNTKARERAELRIRSEEQNIWADVRVEIERLQTGSHQAMLGLTSSRDVPNRTPAEQDAAYTAEQNEQWNVTGTNYQKEIFILEDLRDRLHPLMVLPPGE